MDKLTENPDERNVSVATLVEEIDETGKSLLDLMKSQDKSEQPSAVTKTVTMESSSGEQKKNPENNGELTGTKIKIKPLNALVQDTPQASSNSSDFTIGDIVEHGDFVGSDECGVMHLKITNVMSVDESITGCTVSEDDRDVFANIQIASVTTIMDEDPSSPSGTKDKSTGSDSGITSADAVFDMTTSAAISASSNADISMLAGANATGSGASVCDATDALAPALKLVNLTRLTVEQDATAELVAVCKVRPMLSLCAFSLNLL